jgi:hypothetical protein
VTASRPTLSAAIIVRDEATHLDSCLSTLRDVVDEIVVVDTGSVDDSAAVAKRHGASVWHEPWRADFSAARNRALDRASGDWILYIDADERLIPSDPPALRHCLETDHRHAGWRVPFVPRVGWTPYRELRLWRHDDTVRFTGSIHESVTSGIEALAARDGLVIGHLDGVTIQHLGYEGDQNAKHGRNEPMLRAALAEYPGRSFLYDHLARTYEALGEDERARETWRAGIDMTRLRPGDDPDDRLLWIDLIIHVMGRGDPDGDLDVLLDEACARYEDLPPVQLAVACHELDHGEPGKAAQRFERLASVDAAAAVETESAYDGRIFGEWAWNGLGLARIALGDTAGAADAFRHAEACNPDEPAYAARHRLAEARAAAH